MKRMMRILILLWIPIISKANSCNDIVIQSIELLSSPNSYTEQATITGNEIDLDLTMIQVNESASYKITLQNPSNQTYIIKSTIPQNNNISYQITTNDNNPKIKPHSTKEFVLKITYNKKADYSETESETISKKETIRLEIEKEETIQNPMTYSNYTIKRLLLIIFSS